MSNPFKLSAQQQAEVALVVQRRKRYRYPVPLKVLAFQYGVSISAMNRYVKRAKQ